MLKSRKEELACVGAKQVLCGQRGRLGVKDEVCRICLCRCAHKSCRALSQCLSNHGCFQGLEPHIVQGDPEGQ